MAPWVRRSLRAAALGLGCALLGTATAPMALAGTHESSPSDTTSTSSSPTGSDSSSPTTSDEPTNEPTPSSSSSTSSDTPRPSDSSSGSSSQSTKSNRQFSQAAPNTPPPSWLPTPPDGPPDGGNDPVHSTPPAKSPRATTSAGGETADPGSSDDAGRPGSDDTPTGGVAAGSGSTAGGDPNVPLIVLGLAFVLLGTGVMIHLRQADRRRSLS